MGSIKNSLYPNLSSSRQFSQFIVKIHDAKDWLTKADLEASLANNLPSIV
jgi:hypothetical protein